MNQITRNLFFKFRILLKFVFSGCKGIKFWRMQGSPQFLCRDGNFILKTDIHGIISQLIPGKLAFSFIWVQCLIGSLIPLILLGIISLRKLKDTTMMMCASISSFLILIQVFAMRWNVVIGGQLFSKGLRGFTSYIPSFLGREGILVALILFALPSMPLSGKSLRILNLRR